MTLWFPLSVGLGALLVLDVCHFHLHLFDANHDAAPVAPKRRLIGVRGHIADKAPLAPQYQNTVMPNGQCNITGPVDGLNVTNPIQENTHFIATAINPHYGVHVVVLGRDNRIYHKHQIAHGKWTQDWKCLTPDFSKVPCSAAPYCGGYDNFPQIILQPVNQTLVLFARQMNDLVPHEMHLTNPKDPDSWSDLRGPTCLCNFPPCKNKGQTKCGVLAQCDNKGADCDATPPSSPQFWSNSGPMFPTSEITLLADKENKINIFWRNFDGRYYSTQQETAGDAAGKYGTSTGDQVYDVMIE